MDNESLAIGASPQTKDGYTKYANELLEAIYNINLSSYESRIFLFIGRVTYGFGRKTNRISLTQFENGVYNSEGDLIIRGTNIPHNKIDSTLKSLLQRNLIIKNKNGYITEYGIQKNYELWIDKNKRRLTSSDQIVTDYIETDLTVTNQPVSDQIETPPVTKWSPPSDQIVTESSDQIVTESSDQIVTNKRNKRNKRNIYKETNTKERDEIIKSLFYSYKNDSTYKDIDFDKNWVKFYEFWFEGKKILKRPKAAIINWLDNVIKYNKQTYNGQKGNEPKGVFNGIG